MSAPEIYTWNGNGQACIATKSGVYVLTPEPGINFDTSSLTRASLHNGSKPTEPKSMAGLGWFKTMIDVTKHAPCSWTEISQDWGALALGSLELVLRAIACSPSSLASEDARCVVATLSSNMDLVLWVAIKNHMKGEWIEAVDLTQLLIAHFNNLSEGLSQTAMVLHAQITCITWSQQPNFGITPAPLCDASLLVAGSRAGCLNFFRLGEGRPTAVQLIHTTKVSDKWVTNVAFSTWHLVQLGKCEAYIAYGLSDGAVGIVKVIHTLQSSMSVFGTEHAVDTVFKQYSRGPYDAGKRGITGLAWVTSLDDKPILVHCTPGVVHLWSSSTVTTDLKWTGYRTLSLQTQRLSVGSSSLHPVSGLYHVRHRDALILSLFDGSFHVIQNLSSEPVWSSPTSQASGSHDANSNVHTTENLSTTSRAAFVLAERRDVQHADVNRISAMLPYDSSGAVMWLHEASRPADFSYNSQHCSVFVLVKMWGNGSEEEETRIDEDERVLRDLAETLNNTALDLGHDPIHLLRSIFLYLRGNGRLQRLHSRVLEVLSVHSFGTVDPALSASIGMIALPSFRGEITPEVRQSFRRSLRRGLFGWVDLMSLRMRLSIADYCWKLAQDKVKRDECGRVAEQLLSAISCRVLLVIIRHVVAVAQVLSPSDAPFLTKVISRSMFPGVPPDLAYEAQRLSEVVNAGSDVSSETCPACAAEIPMNDWNNATCVNGHAWIRCSITSFVLSTPLVRTCVGCSRKALCPVPLRSIISAELNDDDAVDYLPAEAAQSWIVQVLLEAVCRCLFCGNSFVSVL